MFFCLIGGFGWVGIGMGVVIGVIPFTYPHQFHPTRTPPIKPSARLELPEVSFGEARVNDSLRDPLTHPV